MEGAGDEAVRSGRVNHSVGGAGDYGEDGVEAIDEYVCGSGIYSERREGSVVVDCGGSDGVSDGRKMKKRDDTEALESTETPGEGVKATAEASQGCLGGV